MPFSGGVYSLPAGNPVVTNTTISSTWANTTLSDISTALSTAVLKDGTQTITANLPMSGFKLTNLAAGASSGDSVRYEQVLLLAGATMAGNINMANTFKVVALAAGTTNGDSLRFEQGLQGILTAKGDIVYASSANTPTRLAIGTTSGMPLVVSAGASLPQWGFDNQNALSIYAGPASGAAAQPSFKQISGAFASVTFLGSKTITNNATVTAGTTGAGVSDIQFDWTSYDEYEFHGVNVVPITSGVNLGMRMSIDGGTTFDASANYLYGNQAWGAAGARLDIASAADTNIVLNGSTSVTVPASGGGISFKATLIKPSATNTRKQVRSEAVYNGVTSSPAISQGGAIGVGSGSQLAASAVNGVQFFFSSLSMASGLIYAYGIRKS